MRPRLYVAEAIAESCDTWLPWPDEACPSALVLADRAERDPRGMLAAIKQIDAEGREETARIVV